MLQQGRSLEPARAGLLGTTTPIPMRPRRARIVFAILMAVVAALGVIGIVPAVSVPGMFGFPDPHGDWLTTAAVATVVGFPVICAASIIAAWVLWCRKRDTVAWACMITPPSVTLVLFIILLWLSY